MKTHANKTPDPQLNTSTNTSAPTLDTQLSTHQLVDKRPEAKEFQSLQLMADNSPQTRQRKEWEKAASNSPRSIQRQEWQAKADEYVAQRKQERNTSTLPTIQRQILDEEDNPVPWHIVAAAISGFSLGFQAAVHQVYNDDGYAFTLPKAIEYVQATYHEEDDAEEEEEDVMDMDVEVEKVKEKPSEESSSSSEEEEEEVDPLAGLTMVQILQKAFTDCGIAKRYKKDTGLFNMLLDMGYHELHNMHIDDKVQKLEPYQKNALLYTSCHNTANKLMRRMADTGGLELGAFTGCSKEEATEKLNNDWMALVSAQLSAAIRNDCQHRNRSIFEVHCGGHGFAIIVREGRAEIVQSFANAVSLVERMARGALLIPQGEVNALILGLASGSVETRNEAANTIADCTAEVFGLMPSPISWQFRWRRCALKSESLILEEYKTDLKKAFLAIKRILFM